VRTTLVHCVIPQSLLQGERGARWRFASRLLRDPESAGIKDNHRLFDCGSLSRYTAPMNDDRRNKVIHVGILVVGLLLVLAASKLPSMSVSFQVLGFGLLVYFGVWLARRMDGGPKRP